MASTLERLDRKQSSTDPAAPGHDIAEHSWRADREISRICLPPTEAPPRRLAVSWVKILSWAGLLLLSLLLWVAILWGVISVLHRLGHPGG
ncbi:MAG: hypothetical protein ACREFH_14445 [Stellaceae bacterium]